MTNTIEARRIGRRRRKRRLITKTIRPASKDREVDPAVTKIS
jgi:hypothetical protein